MINNNDVTKQNMIMNKNIPNWPRIPDDSKRILVTGDPGSGKTN